MIVGIVMVVVFNVEGYCWILVFLFLYFVYKWWCEIQEIVVGVKVWVFNGFDILVKFIKLCEQLGVQLIGQEFFVLGCVRMWMGFYWKFVFIQWCICYGDVVVCLDCGMVIIDFDGELVNLVVFEVEEYCRKCSYCVVFLWMLICLCSLFGSDQFLVVLKVLKCILIIGVVIVQKLMQKFGDGFLVLMFGDNIYEFINFMDGNGELVFFDCQVICMECVMVNMEFGFGEGGYQLFEFIKCYLL